MATRDGQSVPKQMQATYDALIGMTDAFCQEHLNEEYKELARKMAAALSRKRPSPLVSGKLETWACGILYALGQVNFLFDKSQDPHLRADELCAMFGVAKSTGSNKAKTIAEMLKVRRFDAEWCLPSRMEDNPLIWLIQVNGLIVDARHMPREIQEEAFRRGLIPYVPGERTGE